MFKSPRIFDIALLLTLVIFLTFNPYFCDGKINVFETGLYLPGINAILRGGIPFRDVFHLRGPLEIAGPALLMKIFGTHLSVLYGYFSFGNILCLIFCVLIAKELFQSRLMLYLLTPVLVGRTFPRVVYTFWGGMRFAWGLLAILFFIYFFKTRKKLFLFFSGIVSSLAVLTSIDVGVSVLLSVIGFFSFLWILKREKTKQRLKDFSLFMIGFFFVFFPYCVYLYGHQAFFPFFDSMKQIIFVMTKTFPDFIVENQPRDFFDSIRGLNPMSPFFKFVTPAYCYIFAGVYFIILKLKKKEEDKNFLFVSLALYGLILYAFAFRKIGTASFEMALQPEKVLLFFLVEKVIFGLKRQKETQGYISPERVSTFRMPRKVQLFVFYFCLVGVIGSSLGYSFARFSRRFFSFRYVKDTLLRKNTDYLKPYSLDDVQILKSKRIRGIRTTQAQAQEMDQVVQFIQEKTSLGDPVFVYPELGFYSFAFDRPFVGRFPMATFSWFGNGWPQEFFADLYSAKPLYALVSKETPESFQNFYFRVEQNIKYHQRVMQFLKQHYEVVLTTKTFYIYRRKE